MTQKQIHDIKFSILDLAPIVQGGSAADSFKNSLDLARHAEKWGYHRVWVAEHHNMPGIASSATSVLIGYIAGGTTKIRVGSGGIMLPNHAPLVIAEQFGTLESMYPGRIDLGLGRAPGSDQYTAHALRRDLRSGHDFPNQLAELRAYFAPDQHNQRVRAYPGEGLQIPIWLLGSSGFSAQLAGKLGLPFAFASHFSPEYTLPALNLYRQSFQPSEVLQEPYAMVGVNVIAADTDEKAQWLSTSHQQAFLSLIRNKPSQLQPPIESMEHLWTSIEKDAIEKQLGSSVIGNPETVKEKLQAFLDETQADEMIINSHIYDHNERLRSYEIVQEVAMKTR
ncbi:LLM class flavin-dependent oxidoreductase [Alkalihalobacterium chitinilyticum]|uniref:LLM class flavin-dependent oxidoreductase n=1 Tax=Alkalihalobacterium chitinilyticum TaxID=2980103 RepID=A0ABT5VLM3_9BACI|nr:LLM class flavin-dependent oxidoreductase [Alkalihalobacterium chitinilyticum]MDE5416328.1 LLM class flavin-dependent oxidoreductase [Alkalihalobacterium chitinilyticum]